MVDFNRDNTLPRDIVDEMKESYLNYSMSVIVSRALPDVRDGLKPVHRRILYGMSELGSGWNRPYKKSARIVGDVLGKYHPHGDSSVYDALVRMAQSFSLRYELVDGQGNFGSIDGDNAAAMRYTESRMTKLSSEMLKDLEKDTVDWGLNFDETLKEPTVLPSQVPTLLINGSEGIAVGMATKIPPHNLTEIVGALVALIENPEIKTDVLMEHVKGPDFPTAGLIMGVDGLKKAYETGRGKIKMRARAHIESAQNGKDSIVITEVTYQTNKSNLVEKIADLVRDKKIVGITDLRDESDKDGIRVVIETKRDAVPEVILNQLYKHTQLQDTFGIILLALVNGVPKIMPLKEILSHFIEFRHEIVVRRTTFELKEAEARAHLLEGLKIALDNIDEVIKIIRGSKNPTQAKEGLINGFNLSEIQAQAILDMRLQKLTSLEVEKVVSEYKEVIKIIAHLKGILESKKQRMDIIKDELLNIQDQYGDERLTEVIPVDTNFSMEENTEEIKIITPDSPPDPKVEQILEDILSLNLLQVAQLAEGMKDKLGIQDTPMPMMGGGMPMMAAGGAAAPAEDAEPAEEKTAFDVKLTSFDASSKIKVIKEVRAITGLGLKEAKEFVEGAPKVIKEGLKKEECEEIQEKLKAVGGVVEIE